MAVLVTDIADFSNGTVGLRILGSTHPKDPFYGFMDSNNILHYGNAITSRPPLRFISRAPGNHFTRQQFVESLDGKIFLLCIQEPLSSTLSGQNVLSIEIENGLNIKTEPTPIKILSLEGEGNEIVITTPNNAPDLLSIVSLFFNDQQLELYHTAKQTTAPSDPKKYIISPFTGDKENIPVINGTIYHTFRNVVFKTFLLSDLRTILNVKTSALPAPQIFDIDEPVPIHQQFSSRMASPFYSATASPVDKFTKSTPGDSSAIYRYIHAIEDEFVYTNQWDELLPMFLDGQYGTYLTGSKRIVVKPDGSITSTNDNSVTFSNSAADELTGNIQTDANGIKSVQIKIGSSVLNLQPVFGSELYWVRGSFNSETIIMATDRGIYAIRIDPTNTSKIISIVSVDRKISSKCKPALFKSYIIYADDSTESLSYVYQDLYSDRALTSSLGEQSDIFIRRGPIIKMDVVYMHNAPCLFVLTEQGSFFCGAIIDNERERAIRISLGEWMKGYEIVDFAIYNRGTDNNIILFSVRYHGYNFITSMTTENLPTFLDYRFERLPSLDFYSIIEADKMYPLRPNFACNKIDMGPEAMPGQDLKLQIISDIEYFNDTHIGVAIVTELYYIVITQIVSNKIAFGVLQTSNVGDGRYYADGVININTVDGYDLEISKVAGLNHLKVLKDPDFYCYDYNSRLELSVDRAGKCELERGPGYCHFSHGKKVVLGQEYKTYFHTTPIRVADPNPKSSATVYRLFNIEVETFGICEQKMYALITKWIETTPALKNEHKKNFGFILNSDEGNKPMPIKHYSSKILQGGLKTPFLYIESSSLNPMTIIKITLSFSSDA